MAACWSQVKWCTVFVKSFAPLVYNSLVKVYIWYPLYELTPNFGIIFYPCEINIYPSISGFFPNLKSPLKWSGRRYEEHYDGSSCRTRKMICRVFSWAKGKVGKECKSTSGRLWSIKCAIAHLRNFFDNIKGTTNTYNHMHLSLCLFVSIFHWKITLIPAMIYLVCLKKEKMGSDKMKSK